VKILFVIKSLSLPGGGAERVLTAIATALAERGHEITVLSFDPAESADFYSSGPAVRRLRLGIGQRDARSHPLETARRIRDIRNTARHLAPDVAIGFMHSAFIPLSLALLGTGVPTIGSERTSYDHYRTRALQRTLLRATFRLLTAMTVNNDGVRRGFPSALAAKMTVLPNPVMPAQVTADPIGSAEKTLLSVGGLRIEKDHRTLISAFAQLAERFAEWRLRIVGEGPMRGALRAQISKLGLDGRIELAGATTSIEGEYRVAQLFVLPSIYEAFPNCVAEALAHGLPAIGFHDCTGTNALIQPGVNGELAVGPVRVDALRDTLERLMSSPSLRQRLGRQAPSTVEQYSLPATVDRWDQLLQQVARA
jgi:glycosyltransferase involved in cell wall biosynthesis